MKTYKWFGYIAVSLVVLSLLAVSLYKTPKAYADDKVFSDLIMQAETWSVTMMNLPNAYNGKSDIPDSAIQDSHNTQTSTVNNLFTGDYRKSAQAIVDTNFNNANYNRELGGGVNWIKINSLTVTGNSAIANVEVSKYILFKIAKDGKLYCGKTEGTGNDVFYFTQDNGQWKISQIGGTGPSGDTTLTLTPLTP
jgi:hypothetical protein